MIWLWTRMVMVLKDFQREIICGDDFSACIDICNSVRDYHDLLITIQTQIEYNVLFNEE